jgi:hypothetical protein
MVLKTISTQEKFPRTENFPEISLLKVENFQPQNFFRRKICVGQSLRKMFLSGNAWAFIFYSLAKGFWLSSCWLTSTKPCKHYAFCGLHLSKKSVFGISNTFFTIASYTTAIIVQNLTFASLFQSRWDDNQRNHLWQSVHLYIYKGIIHLYSPNNSQ